MTGERIRNGPEIAGSPFFMFERDSVIMRKKKQEAGDLLDARCTKCKVVRIHTIVAMVDGQVVRVKCNSCGGEHNYHPPKEEKVSKPRRAAVARVGSSLSARGNSVSSLDYGEQWQSIMSGKDENLAVPYSSDGKYRKEILLAHPTFGMGVVQALSYGKINVLFKDGQKWLASAR